MRDVALTASQVVELYALGPAGIYIPRRRRVYSAPSAAAPATLVQDPIGMGVIPFAR